MRNNSKLINWVGIALITAVGLIHIISAPDSFAEATYKGVLFLANGVGALIAAYGIWNDKRWGWSMGLLVAAGALAGYVMSRTIGLPGLPAEPDAWFEPIGLLSMLTEGLFSLVALWGISSIAAYMRGNVRPIRAA